jgi:hypothetical protein
MTDYSIPISAMFREINKISDVGIDGYHAEKVYCDPLRQVK